MIIYKTVSQEAEVFYEVEKSKFITHVKPVESRKEAEKFIDEIRRKYKDATHNVPVFVVGEHMQLQWASDDGEPQGSSGPPMLQMLVKKEITNIVLVVTRYFGGRKLGKGGLVRAYTTSAQKGVEKAEVVGVVDSEEIHVLIDYKYLPIIENIESKYDFNIKDRQFGEKITLILLTERENTATIENVLHNLTAGQIKIIKKDSKKSYKVLDK